MNETGNETSYPLSWEVKIGYTCFISLTIIIGIVGNFLVIYVVTRYSSMQTITNMHLMNLAIADLIYLLSGLIAMSNIVTGDFKFGKIGCKIYLIMSGINSFTSTYSMTLMSIDRYLAVCHPISSIKFRTTNITILTLICLWLFSFTLMIPLLRYGIIGYIPPTVHNGTYTRGCIINWMSDLTNHSFIIYNFILGFLIPIILICVIYPQIIARLRKAGPGSIKSRERRDSNRRVTRLVFAIILTFILLWLPYWIFQSIIVSITQETFTNLFINISMIVQWLTYLNSTLNPILYAFMSANFRASFSHLISTCCCCCHSFWQRQMLIIAPTGGLYTQTGTHENNNNNINLELDYQQNHLNQFNRILKSSVHTKSVNQQTSIIT